MLDLETPPPHHDEEPKLLLSRALDPETVSVLAGVAREIADRKARRISIAYLDAPYLDAYASMAALSYRSTAPAKSYNALLQLAAVAIEQANLLARTAEGKRGLAITATRAPHE